jgi:RNase P/RNase MRP subunit p30
VRSRSQIDLLEIDDTNDLTAVKAAVKSTLARPNCLYIDSDLSKIKVVEKLFKSVSKNSKIVFAEHAEEALEKLKVMNNNFDIIIVAEQLSLDGFLGHEFVEGMTI